ncbi:hypothetical protein PtA15_5A787 [Puccinia triticina]|uniref:Uncharacterized protein n=1 Tax=Puccinia triticina TaxID=208348 RepID=A0ABY7CLK5_9BASI|nr:uncharacterized protein PtA15_5A787 [Puccinia triticina]WAQ85213.1 hypothetical protein PtA15_5A787 [Puccinia triticina]
MAPLTFLTLVLWIITAVILLLRLGAQIPLDEPRSSQAGGIGGTEAELAHGAPSSLFPRFGTIKGEDSVPSSGDGEDALSDVQIPAATRGAPPSTPQLTTKACQTSPPAPHAFADARQEARTSTALLWAIDAIPIKKRTKAKRNGASH